MTPEQALDNLYKAARAISATAEVHEAIALSYQVLKETLKPAEVPDA